MSLEIQPTQPLEKEEVIEETLLDSEPIAEAGASCTGGHRAEPVSATERVGAIDTLRGFALLGILAMNIVAFAWPGPAYDNPFRGAGFEGTDRAVWFFNHLVFEAKMMTIFSMLFGAGLVLMDQRAEKRGARIRGVYYLSLIHI